MARTAQDWADQLSDLLDHAPSAEHLLTENDAALIDLIAATERAKGRLAAAQARAEAAFWDAQIREQERLGVPRGQRARGIADQVALARRISPTQASDEVALHRVLLESLPRTSALLDAGEISEFAARKVAENVLVLEDEDRERVDADLADRLPTVTARRAGDLTRARAQELDPDAAVRRHQRAVADRRVSLQPAVDGMSVLRATLPVKDGVAVLKVLTDAAKSAKAGGDPRTKGQIMADTLTSRTCGLESPEDIPVEIQLLMTDMTLLGDEEATAWIDGHPLPGRIARSLALGAPGPQAAEAEHAGDAPPRPAAPPPEIGRAARWLRRLYTDARTGEPTAVDGRRRLFRGEIRRFILLRDQQCRTPWCDAAIHDIDHARRHADGGRTDADNGVGHCQRFNLVKEMPGWESTVEPARAGRASRLTIRTPTGHVYQSTSPLLRRLLDGPAGERSTVLAEEPIGPDDDPPTPTVDPSPGRQDDDPTRGELEKADDDLPEPEARTG
jgi:hypothetical protein